MTQSAANLICDGTHGFVLTALKAPAVFSMSGPVQGIEKSNGWQAPGYHMPSSSLT